MATAKSVLGEVYGANELTHFESFIHRCRENALSTLPEALAYYYRELIERAEQVIEEGKEHLSQQQNKLARLRSPDAILDKEFQEAFQQEKTRNDRRARRQEEIERSTKYLEKAQELYDKFVAERKENEGLSVHREALVEIFQALRIDTERFFRERRRAQNAFDAIPEFTFEDWAVEQTERAKINVDYYEKYMNEGAAALAIAREKLALLKPDTDVE